MAARVWLSLFLCLAMAKSGLGVEPRGPGRPHELLCHCRFVKLSTQAAAEFFAAAELVTPRLPQDGSPDFRLCKNAEAALLSLKKAGRATIWDCGLGPKRRRGPRENEKRSQKTRLR